MQSLYKLLTHKGGYINRVCRLEGLGLALEAIHLAEETDDSDILCLLDASSEIDSFYQLLLHLSEEKAIACLRFPDWETLPYDAFSPDQGIISERLKTLSALTSTPGNRIIVASVANTSFRLPPVSFVKGHVLSLKKGDHVNIRELKENLTQSGYLAVKTVTEPGEFAIRGAILDLYPMGYLSPIRLDFFDEELDSIRRFDPETQRTITQVDEASIMPGREYPLTPTATQLFSTQFKQNFEINLRNCSLYQSIRQQMPAPGSEYFLPLFFDGTASFFDYFLKPPVILHNARLPAIRDEVLKNVHDRYDQKSHDPHHPILPPADILLSESEFFEAIKQSCRVESHEQDSSSELQLPYASLPQSFLSNIPGKPCAVVKEYIHQHSDACVILTASSAGRMSYLQELCERSDLTPTTEISLLEALEKSQGLYLTTAPLTKGIQAQKALVIAESDLLGRTPSYTTSRKSKQSNEAVFRSLSELEVGTPVVHVDHGVGRYLGLEHMQTDGQENEFLLLEYAGETKLYVPVSDLEKISRYSGIAPDHVQLNRLGTDRWSKAKQQAQEKIRDVAAELLSAQASRVNRQGKSIETESEAYDRFSAGFSFEETEDQATAIDAVLSDMKKPEPMDRVICGDVGFGKTEVALRAAFVAANSGYQVLVLAPTTLVVQQHYENFLSRFKDFPIEVESLSRFKTKKDSDEVVLKLRQGKVDIVIGTHRLLQSDIKPKNLGLLIVDEEHRFGVRQKEAIKKLRAEVDILTMTATPIPRTLNMSLQGMRDLSIISTPPVSRLAVKTFVHPYRNDIIREAILREIMRGGQVYVLHNEVKSIQARMESLEKLIPEASFGVGHGQMPERELESVMAAFQRRQFNVLICSTIIETGIDIPNANTIIIERADKFGLAQLHQLRGRVGRSHHQAYAYLMTPDPKSMTDDAFKRLEAIRKTHDLGAGFTLASHDLEIRGAGELLGEEQSGQIEGIGYTLYMDLLQQTIDALRKGETPSFDDIGGGNQKDINLNMACLIPSDYLPDPHLRLTLYKQIAETQDDDAVSHLKIEIIDRYGMPPQALLNLLELQRLKNRMQHLRIEKLSVNDRGGTLSFGAKTPVDPLKIISLIQAYPSRYRMKGGSALGFTKDLPIGTERTDYIHDLLDKLTAA